LVAPLAVKVAELPLQIAVGLETMVKVGVGNTRILTVLVLVQPEALVPVTVYTVVAVGVTVTLVPIKLPGTHV